MVQKECCYKKPSVVVWLFALSYEMCRDVSHHCSKGYWVMICFTAQLYIGYEWNIAHDPSASRRIFIHAIHACPWLKPLWLDGVSNHIVLTGNETFVLQQVMWDKELNFMVIW